MKIFFVLLSLLWLNNAQAQISWASTRYDDQNPIISPDGKTRYMTLAFHPQNIGGEKDAGDIWYATWSGTTWSDWIHGGDKINNRHYNLIAGFSSDGQQMYLFNHYNMELPKQGLAISEWKNNAWSTPINFSIPEFKSQTTITGSFHAGLGVLVYAAQAYESIGAEDIYVARLENGQWTEPIHTGKTINTTNEEATPFLSDDGKTLYFSSNGLNGLGSFDVYQTARQDDSWTSWSTPVNMGTSINSSGKELFYRIVQYDSVAYYTSTQNSDGFGDVKIFSWGKKLIQKIKKDSVWKKSAGTKIRLNNVLFDTGTARLLPESYDELNRVVQFMQANNIKIQLEGHTDKTGDSRLNMKLSLTRVKTVKQYLIEQGIEKSRLFTKGFGDTRPLSNGNSEEDKRKNRRVEFVVMGEL